MLLPAPRDFAVFLSVRSTTVVFRFGRPPKRDVILLVMDETMICNPNTYSYTRIQTQSN